MEKATSILNKCNVHWRDHTGKYPLLYNLNVARGCEHDCSYCYARMLSARWGLVTDWKRAKPIVNAIELLQKEVVKKPKGRVMVCSMTDPYQNEEVAKITRQALEILLPRGFYVLLCTKNKLVRKDLELISRFENIELGVTVIGLDDQAIKKYESGSSLVSERIEVIKEAKRLGIKVYVSMEPWIPEVTNPLEIVKALNQYVYRFIIGRYNYHGRNQELNEIYRKKLPKAIEYLENNGGRWMLKPDMAEAVPGVKPFKM